MTGEQWLGTIANKPGVKGEELDRTGLKSFLEENKGKPVTKAQIEEHLAANKVELKEVRKGGEAGTKEKAFEIEKNPGELRLLHFQGRRAAGDRNGTDIVLGVLVFGLLSGFLPLEFLVLSSRLLLE